MASVLGVWDWQDQTTSTLFFLISPAIARPLELSALALQTYKMGPTQSNNNPNHNWRRYLNCSTYEAA